MSLTEDDKKWMTERFATKQDLERVETNLLTEFHKPVTPFEARLRTRTAMLHTLAVDMEYRIQKLEDSGRPH
jgi:hypothetical protein